MTGLAAAARQHLRGRQTVALPGGRLWIDVEHADEPVGALCTFGARAGNARRPFLVISRVLGKHIAVRPSRMTQIHDRLAARIPSALPGPVLMIGLAETATGLGEGIYDRYRTATERDDLWYASSTRNRNDDRRGLQFIEPHSHAPEHWVYESSRRGGFAAVRSAVLIDDEITSGQTLQNLSTVLRQACPRVTTIVRVAITDWSGRTASDAPPALALVRGIIRYAPDDGSTPDPADGDDPDAAVAEGSGPLGIVPEAIQEHADRLRVAAGSRALVIGHGEFLHRPYQLACALESRGIDVRFQSTTRTPAQVWGGIKSALHFRDPAEGGAMRYLYNAERRHFDRIIVCRPSASVLMAPELIEPLGADVATLA